MTPLSKKTRNIILIILAIIFIVITPFIIAISFGYKYEKLEDILTFVKTGGIYVHSDVSNTNVFLDGEFIESRGLLLRNTFIQDLRPDQEYDVLIQKDGFHDWQKTLMVEESLVTEARILMIPTEIKKTAIYPFIDNLGVGTTTELSASTTPYSDNEEYLEIDLLFNPVAATTTEIITFATSTLPKKEIPEYFIDLGVENPDDLENLVVLNNQIAWLEDGDIILHWIGREDSTPYYYCLDHESCRSTISLDWVDQIKSFDFLPGREDVFIVLIDNGLYAVEIDDRSDRNIQPIYFGENINFRLSDRNRIVVQDGLVYFELRF